jgi:hypothetical protein
MFATLTPEYVKTLMSLVLFGSGMLTITFGIWRLLARDFQTTMRALAAQSARIGQKAITDGVADVADSAARLMDSVNQLVRTSAGIGAFLTIFGLVQVVAAYLVIRY